ncbi:hypothetical protein GQ42DRAFT_157377 [Ramicandelaber brevisporus]|nr:hypothetical protein GQ42DRAFT_157377 [Ramicandelaber brevisporus]
MISFLSRFFSGSGQKKDSTTTTDPPSRNSPILPTHHQYSPVSNTNGNANNEKTSQSNVFTSFLSRIFALFRHSPAASNDVAPPQYLGIPGSDNSVTFISVPIWIDDIGKTTSYYETVISFFTRTFSGVRTAYNATTKFVSQKIKSATLPARMPLVLYMSILSSDGTELRYPCYPEKRHSLESYDQQY